MNRIFVCDIESGGLNPKTDAMCSITLKEYRKNNILNIYIKPTKLNYNKRAMEVNGLTKNILKEQGITELQAISKINIFLENQKIELLGQNTKFDYEFLREMFKRHNKLELFNSLFSWRLRDTMPIAMFFDDCGIMKFDSFSLENIHKGFFGKSIRNAHTSLGDVKATERIYKRMIDLFEPKLELRATKVEVKNGKNKKRPRTRQ